MVDGAEQIKNLGGGGVVQFAGGFVREQQRRAVGERDGDGDALLLAGRTAFRGYGLAGVRVPTRFRSSSARSRRSAPGVFVSIIGSVTFSSVDRYGNRLRLVCCQMKPTSTRRYSSTSRAVIRSKSLPPTLTPPADGVS